jgi:hypothetical protein
MLGKEQPDAEIGRYLADGSYVLSGTGRDAVDSAEQGSFAGISTEASNFTFIARVAKGPAGTPDPQYGISIRAGVAATDKAVSIRYDGRPQFRCAAWIMRHLVTPSTHDGSSRGYLLRFERELTSVEGKWLKIVRRYPYVWLYTSDDGAKWCELGPDYLKALLVQKVWVGLRLTAGGDGSRPVSVVFDRISFTIDTADAKAESQADYRECPLPSRPFRMHLARVPGKSNDDFGSAYLIMPKDMDPTKIRVLFYTTGNKEETVDGKQMEWESGGRSARRPKGFADWEGTLDLDQVQPRNHILAHYGMVRVAGIFPLEQFPEALAALAERSGIRHLANIPLVSMGASATGGAAARSAALFPERTIACAPTLIGMAGADTTDPRVLATPHLYIIGSRDGPHLRQALEAIPRLRDNRAVWAVAPMWRVYHRTHKSFGLMMPYFLEAIRLRLPAQADYSKGLPKLAALKEDEGWFGLVDTWETDYPQVVPVKQYRGNSKNLVWLPSELTARLWQAFVSENPKTIIHFPCMDGYGGYGQPDPPGWHNSLLEADKPFELVASGPLGKEVRVEYYAGLRKLKILKGKDYRVTLEGLEPGLHAIYAITTVDGVKEISRPVTVFFHGKHRQ